MPARDDDLVSQLDEARGWRRTELAAALGDSEGETGPPRLRELLSETGTRTSDLRCAAVLSLAKRCKEEAHDDFVIAFHSTDAGTRDYAVLALAAYGRDGLWDEVAQRLAQRLRRRNRRGTAPPSTTVLMITYLARHAAREPGRVERLVDGLRREWSGLDPVQDDGFVLLDHRGLQANAAWIHDYWREAAPDGPAADRVASPDTELMERWVRNDPLFRSISDLRE